MKHATIITMTLAAILLLTGGIIAILIHHREKEPSNETTFILR